MAIRISEKKAGRIYKFVKLLIQSVPESIQEEVHTELLFRGLELCKKSDAYIFTSLKNRKIDLLRGSLGKSVHTKVVDHEKADRETVRFLEELEFTKEFGLLYVTYKYLTPVYRKFFRDIIRHIRLKKEWTVRKSCKRCKFSDKRGYKVFSEIKSIHQAVCKTTHIEVPKNISSFQEFYEAILHYRQ